MVILVIILFLIILGLLVFVHELGHFLIARRNGVKVEEFGFGFPPRLGGFYRSSETGKLRWFWKKNDKLRKDIADTVYSINWIPLGGFVKLLGEEEICDHPRSFSCKSPWARTKVLVAGVLGNFLLAWILLTIWFWIIPRNLPQEIVVISVGKNSPADIAGIKPNDFILKGDDQNIKTTKDLSNFTKSHQGQEAIFTIEHFGKNIEKTIKLGENTDTPLGISMAEIGGDQIPKFPWWQAPYYAFMEMIAVIWMSLQFIGGLIASLFGGAKVSTESVSGPVGIFAFLYQIIYFGVAYIIRFAALLSVAIGFFNILPFPALDGGRLVFVAAEAIRGKKIVKMEFESMLHWIGFLILLALVAVITYHDIGRWL